MMTDYYSEIQFAIIDYLIIHGSATAAEIIKTCPCPTIPVGADLQAAKTEAMFSLRLSGDLIGPEGEGHYHLSEKAEEMYRQAFLRSEAKQDRSLEYMLALANCLREDLKPLADKIEIGGSIRRRKPMVGDIEIIALVNSDGVGNELLRRSIVTLKNGQKYKQVIIKPPAGPVVVDLFQTRNPAEWGMLFFIRTGSADFVRRALGHWKKISDGGECRENILYRGDGSMVQTFDETAVFAALKCPFVTPERRIPRDGG